MKKPPKPGLLNDPDQTLFTPEQLAGLQQARDSLRATFPGKGDHTIAEYLAAAIVPRPFFSTLPHAVVMTVATTAVGAATLLYGRHPETGEMSIILVRRRETDADGIHMLGVPGGFTNPGYYELTPNGIVAHNDEQPQEGALREKDEELCDSHGLPFLSIDRSRLSIIHTGIDEKSLAAGGPPTTYHGYAVELDDEEMQKMLDHSLRMVNDDAYHDAVIEETHGETRGVEIFSLSEITSLSAEQFTHKHELTAVQLLADLVTDHTAPDSARARLLRRKIIHPVPAN